MVASPRFNPQMHFFAWPDTLSKREEAIQFIKYMGSKREIVDFVSTTIQDALAHEPGASILDLMAGTCAVGYALSGNHRIIANDVQHYSYALSQALLNTRGALPSGEVVWEFLEPYVAENSALLHELLASHLEAEKAFLTAENFTQTFIRQYTRFMSDYPHAGSLRHSPTYNGLCERFTRMIEDRRSAPTSRPYCLFTMYFGNAYFGLAQAIEFDSIRFAIDQALEPNSESWYVAIACLMHAASYCTPGPGHFAQFRAVNSPEVCGDILGYRNRSPKAYFIQKWNEFRTNYRPPAYKNECVTGDFRRTLRNFIQEVDLVYADPPYSFVHYSRFYHALETLVLYDYPTCEFYGRYRGDRHQSPFCIRSKVKKAFEDVIVPVAEHGKRLVISYSNTGMITLDDLRRLCATHFGGNRVRTVCSDYLHATMGRRGDKTREVQEVLIVCGA